MELETFLQEIVDFINEANGGRRQETLQASAERIMYAYVMLMREGDIYRKLEEALRGDAELYVLVLSTIYYVTLDSRCLEIVDDLILAGEFDLFTSSALCFQLSNIRFRDEKLIADYGKQRAIQRGLLERFESEYPVVPAYLPYGERSKKRIVVETDCINGYYHAPTRTVLEMCRVLQEELGYEVFLLVNMVKMEQKRMEQFWLFPYVRNYRKDLDGSFSLSYQGCDISGYQLSVGSENIDELREILSRIREWKPLCIWHIGGSGFLHDLVRGMTTLLSMPCTDGYSISEAPVMVSYMQSGSERVRKQQNVMRQSGQKTVNVKLIMEHREQGKNYKKVDFGLPEDAFVLCVVGNRLDDEMTPPFVDMLENALSESGKLCIVIIGKCHKMPFSECFCDRVKFLGFREDLVDVIKAVDLFVNPPRKGGGGGALRAIAMGVPVLTMPHCDVANFVNEEFFVQDLQQMGQAIKRYLSDQDYYMRQSRKSLELYAQRSKNSNADSVREMLDQVERWLQNREIN